MCADKHMLHAHKQASVACNGQTGCMHLHALKLLRALDTCTQINAATYMCRHACLDMLMKRAIDAIMHVLDEARICGT